MFMSDGTSNWIITCLVWHECFVKISRAVTWWWEEHVSSSMSLLTRFAQVNTSSATDIISWPHMTLDWRNFDTDRTRSVRVLWGDTGASWDRLSSVSQLMPGYWTGHGCEWVVFMLSNAWRGCNVIWQHTFEQNILSWLDVSVIKLTSR